MLVIYGQSNCVFCDRAKQLADEYNLISVYYDLSDVDVQKVFKQKFPDAKTVPQIEWYGKHVGGYAEFAQEIENTIGGYGEQQC